MSLSQQLNSISEASTSAVVDRKSRSKIHSRSIIFDPKVAATQDFELIYSISLEGLDELISVDKRFGKFKGTLFHETTVTYDRNVQQQDMLEKLNENINQFLYLVSPHLHLNCSVKALEWLVRRFNINLYNGEMLLLMSLSYHKEPIFVKFLNVIPKNSFPRIFESLMGFKELLKNPSSISILKNFINNYELFKLYTLFAIDQLERKLVFKSQLIFYLSISIQLLSSLSKDQQRIESEYLPLLLRLIHSLLISGSHDNLVTAFSLISVISSILSLNSKVISSLSEVIINNQECLQPNILKKTLITLGHLWQSYLPEFEPVHIQQFEFDVELIEILISEKYNIAKFLSYYYISNLHQLNVFKYFEFLNIQENSTFKLVTENVLKQVTTTDKVTKDNVTKSIERLYKQDAELFKKLCTIKITELEMILMTTLDNELEEELEEQFFEAGAEDEIEDVIETEVFSSTSTFFTKNSTSEFNQLSLVLLANLNSIESFSTQFESYESYLTFLIRFSLTPSLPIIARLKVLAKVNKLFKGRVTNGKQYYLIFPIILIGLYDSNKLIRQYYLHLLNTIKSTAPTNSTLYLENEIYDEVPDNKRCLIAPKDGTYLLSVASQLSLEDLIVDPSKIIDKLVLLFTHAKPNSKKFGQTHLKSFILNQWSLVHLPLTFKYKIWGIMSLANQRDNDYRVFFNEDLSNYLPQRPSLIKESESIKVEFSNIENDLVKLIGGINISVKEVDLLLNLLGVNSELVTIRLIDIFPSCNAELKSKIYSKLIDLLLEDSSDFDPFEVLSNMKLDTKLILSILGTVQINNQVPDQAIVKRKRRSSSQTKQNLARNEITNMASFHLKKLTIVLDLLDYNLTENLKINQDEISRPDLLIELFKILTDLDYLGNDGHLPVLYAQETLANCMSSSIKLMKFKDFKYDSNSIRADLIVNSIRNSNSPQVQNRLLLVIAELASLAPEIILHSVMPIFTFMGAHTIKQDDEFSNQALQETVSRVIPALAQNGTTNLDEDIEFLLASFVAALQHIPRHRLNKLFSSLVKTLTIDKSLHTILFLVGNQYHKVTNNEDIRRSLIEFCSTLLQNFSPFEQLQSIYKFLSLWKTIPDQPLEKNSDLYNELIKRPIYGVSVLSLTGDELNGLKSGLLGYLNKIISIKDEFNEINLLKLKISIELLDQDIEDKSELLIIFNNISSFLLKSIDSTDFTTNLYELLNHFLDMLPISFFIDSIIGSLSDIKDITISRNFANLMSTKFEEELNINNTTPEIITIIQSKLLPVLVDGINKNIDTLLQQSYLDGLSIVISKLFVIDSSLFNDSKSLTNLLTIILSEKGLLSNQPELIISSVNLVNHIINILGVKVIGFFPKILNPSFTIWEKFKSEELVHTSILILYSSLIKKLSAFLGNSLDKILVIILESNVDNELRSQILDLVVKHVELSKVLKSLCNIWINGFYENDLADNLGLYLNCLQSTIDEIDKKSAISNSSLVLKWLIKSFEFRHYCETNDKFNNNTIYRFESSFHKCGISFIMKLNDKSFRPLFASLSRWCINGEDSIINDEFSRYISFFKFFNKLQEELKSIVTSYYSYLIEPVGELLTRFENGTEETNLRRIILTSLNTSFKYDQDDYWSQESRFALICNPLIGQLSNIEDSIGKYLLRALTSFTANVSSDEYSGVIVNKLITYVSDDSDSKTKIWTIRTLKSIFQKLGESWLTHLPVLIPYIAELLEDDDEAVELEVRNGLIRVIENVLGEPLDRYLD